jgi:hypothetical protein
MKKTEKEKEEKRKKRKRGLGVEHRNEPTAHPGLKIRTGTPVLSISL